MAQLHYTLGQKILDQNILSLSLTGLFLVSELIILIYNSLYLGWHAYTPDILLKFDYIYAMTVYFCEPVCQIYIPFQNRVAVYKLTIREITSSTNKKIEKQTVYWM